jgi:hypothetical protein
MVGGSTDPVLLAFPAERAVTAEDVADWVLGDYVPVACFPFDQATAPKLYSIVWDRAGNIGTPATLQYLLERVNTNFWILSLLDGGAVLQAGDLIRVIIGR